MAAVRYPESGGAYRGARAKKHITQERLASEVGVTPRTIIRYENGETRPSPAVRDRIAEMLEVEPDTLPAAGEDPFVFSATRTTIRSSNGFAKRLGAWLQRRSA